MFSSILYALCAVVNGLTLDENFDNLNSWQVDVEGALSYAYLSPSTFNGTTSMLSTNVSYCGSGMCYRAEVDMNSTLRSNVISGTSGLYWIAFSNYIPEDWVWMGETTPGQNEVIYQFQLHGGDNLGRSPIVGLRNEGDEMRINICGNNQFHSPTSSCYYYPVGPVAIGVWMDWVIEVNLEHEDKKNGYVNVWKNNEQVLAVKGLYVGYDDINVPYLKVGSYDIPWKSNIYTLTQWTGVAISRIRVGNSTSSYDEVYTGNGAACGQYCVFSRSSSGDDDETSLHIDTIIIVAVVPLGVIACIVVLFYFANRSIDDKFANDPALVGYAVDEADGQEDGDYFDDEKISTQHRSNLDYSDNDDSIRMRSGSGREGSLRVSRLSNLRASIVDGARGSLMAVRDSLVWAGEEDFVHNSKFVWSDPWQASWQRQLLWYCFGYGSVLGMLVFSMVLYGNPITNQPGLMEWARLRSWSAVKAASVMCVSLVTTGMYFLPLAFMPHKLDEGKTYQNNPDFLKRIGVVIPCHKSALEIGGVLKQVLKYIPPQNVCVCDNGNFNWPADNTFEVVKAINADVQYCFISQGHKTRALWTGANRLPRHCEYLIHLDDDTLLSDHMVFDERHFLTDGGQHVAAVAFLRTSFKLNLVTNFTDFWYKITDHFHATQAKIATRAFVPGPAGMWRKDRFLEVFGAHPALPFGEDIFGGFTSLNKGYCIRAETRCMVTTFAPSILVSCGGGGRVQGYGASSLWKQRAHRWTVSALRITGKSLYSFGTYDTKGGVLSNIAFRLYRLREYKIIFVQVLYIPFCIVILARGFIWEFIVVKIMLFIWPLLRNLYINYFCWRGQPELQVPLQTVLLSPLFNYFLIMCAIHGRLKCLLWYIPNVPPNHGMLQRCQPRPIAVVKARSQQMHQRQRRSLFGRASQQLNSDDASVANDDEVLSPLTVATAASSGYDVSGVTPTSTAEVSSTSSVINGDKGSLVASSDVETGLHAMKVVAPAPEMRDDGFAEDVIANPSSADSFEFFYRDGTSVFVSFYSLERVDNFIPTHRPSRSSLPSTHSTGSLKAAESCNAAALPSRYDGAADSLGRITEGSRETSREGISSGSISASTSYLPPFEKTPIPEENGSPSDGTNGEKK